MVIGVTGKYCSGKDTVVSFLRDSGFTEINVDKIGHDILEDKNKDIVKVFGRKILKENSSINRRKLGNIVFSDKEEMKKLELILHPAMINRVKENIKDLNSKIIINAAILFKMGLEKLCNAVFYIKTPFFKRFLHALNRDSLTIRETLKRLINQKIICSKSKHNHVDIYYIRNDKNELALRNQIFNILDKISVR